MDLSCSFPVLCVQASGHSCLKSTAYVSWGNGHGKDDRETSSKMCGCFVLFFNLSITSFEWERDSPINQSTYWCCEQPVTHWGNETLDCHISSRGMITRGALMCFPAANLYDNHSLAKTLLAPLPILTLKCPALFNQGDHAAEAYSPQSQSSWMRNESNFLVPVHTSSKTSQ